MPKSARTTFIAEDGEVVRPVDEGKRACTPGRATGAGHKDVNSASIGIELDQPGHANGYPRFAEAADRSAGASCSTTSSARHDIPAPTSSGTRTSPGAQARSWRAVPWDRLAEYRLVPAAARKGSIFGDPFSNDGSFYLALERFGYEVSAGKKAVEAFQRRWRPERIDGEIDGEVRAILFQLLLDRDSGKTR
jgi:N-acetylmuramoyl-L-alanine amidase